MKGKKSLVDYQCSCLRLFMTEKLSSRQSTQIGDEMTIYIFLIKFGHVTGIRGLIMQFVSIKRYAHV